MFNCYSIDLACVDPEGKGQGVQTPSRLPPKITSSLGLYKNKQLDPVSLEKNCINLVSL